MSVTESAPTRLLGQAFEDDHDQFRDSLRSFVDRVVRPQLSEWRTAGAVDSGFHLSAAAQGILGTTVPEHLGGGGSEDRRFGLVAAQELMRVGATGAALALGLTETVVAPALAVADAHPGARDVLAGIASGTKRVAYIDLDATVLVTADSGIVTLDGRAGTVIDGAHATDYVVLARTEAGADLLIVLDARTPGITCSAQSRPVGALDSGSAAVEFDKVQVEPSAVVRQEQSLRGTIWSDTALAVAAICLAGAEEALRWTVDYVQDRTVFGRSVFAFDNTQSILGRLLGSVIAARSIFGDCVRAQHTGGAGSTEAAALLVTSTDLFSSVVDKGLQLHGGFGYMHEYPIAQAFADARFIELLVDEVESPGTVLARSL
ncbi:acyl-CoA dehydrogenase family protein [Rhodococcus olei]|uniref:Acyl-CoA dehydrogenase family protein n=1 Tax=Rhodococcus olei TaxID=2161675 RepID=A0ABP8PSA4_9NOCA